MAEKHSPKPVGVDLAKDGVNGPVPEEIKGWNWGAFFLTWVWGLSHRVWWSLLCFVPYVGPFMAIVLGLKGNEWAWQGRKFSSVAEFKTVQRAWTRAGVSILIATVVIMIILIGLIIYFVGSVGGSSLPR